MFAIVEARGASVDSGVGRRAELTVVEPLESLWRRGFETADETLIKR